MDHCYSRPWNWRPESNFLRPTKTLFVSKPNTKRRLSTNPLAPLQDEEDSLDVEYVPPESPLIYDEGRAKQLMEECEKHAKLGRGEQQSDNWEEAVLAQRYMKILIEENIKLLIIIIIIKTVFLKKCA